MHPTIPTRSEPEPAAPAPHSLSEGIAALLQRPVSRAVRRRAALHVLDWVGCAIAGRAATPGELFARYGTARGAGPCHAIGVGRLEAAAAAFVNGAYGNVLEMDDIHRTSVLHPGPVVIPAALAATERAGAKAETLLDAVVRGYEAVIRIGRSVGPGHYRQWHNTSTCGPFGAASAAASVLALDPQETTSALGLAGTQASGPWQCRLDGPGAKQLHTAAAAQAGLAAADLAALGLAGPRAILEGPLGFYAAMCPDPEPGAVLARSACEWLIEETSFKPWPACRHAHAAIDAALALCAEIGDTPVEAVAVTSYPDALRYCDQPLPLTPHEARFSLQHCVAVTLLDGPPTLEAFAQTSIGRADVAALRERVRLAATEPFASAYPNHFGARLRLRLADGRELDAQVPDALGDPENPIDATAVREKSRMLMTAGGVSERRAVAIADAVEALAGGGAIADLRDLLP